MEKHLEKLKKRLEEDPNNEHLKRHMKRITEYVSKQKNHF